MPPLDSAPSGEISIELLQTPFSRFHEMQRKMKQNGSKTYRNPRFACCLAGIGLLVSPLGMAQELAGSNEPKPTRPRLAATAMIGSNRNLRD